MCIYVYVCGYIYIYIYIYICTGALPGAKIPEYVLYEERWLMLAIVSALALLSDWVSVCIYININIYVYIYMYMYLHIHIYVVCMRVSVCACVLCPRCCQIALMVRKDVRKQEIFKMKKDIVRLS